MASESRNPFETRIRVRFGDVDRAGIAYYPRILHYCHVTFEEFFDRFVGIPYPEILGARALGFPTVKIETQFEKPFTYGMDVVARLAVSRIGRSSTTWDYVFLDRRGGTLLARSTNETVAVDMATFRPVSIPDDLRAAFSRCNAGD